jgi:uncharacterized protein YqcC (DUF446 family)
MTRNKPSAKEAIYRRALDSISRIEAEMKRIGYWSAEPLPQAAYEFHQAFAQDTMTFVQWLQFILVPRVHQIIEQRGEFPTSSMVGAQAVREFDGDTDAATLVQLLIEFDSLFRGK